MCVFKQGEIWWYEFTIQGKRFRRSSRTTDRDLAILIEDEHRSRIGDGSVSTPPTLETIEAKRKAARLPLPSPSATPPRHITPSMTLKEAGMVWLETKIWTRRKPKTLECNRQYLWNLLQFFGDTPISEIHAGLLRDYQAERQKVAGPSAINHETIALGGILRQAGLWWKISDHYAPLSTPEWQRPKVFTADEEELFGHASFRLMGPPRKHSAKPSKGQTIWVRTDQSISSFPFASTAARGIRNGRLARAGCASKQRG